MANSRLKKLVAAFFFIAVTIYFMIPIMDPDFPWHIKTGEYIYQHREIPKTDPFSIASTGSPVGKVPLIAILAGAGNLLSHFFNNRASRNYHAAESYFCGNYRHLMVFDEGCPPAVKRHVSFTLRPLFFLFIWATGLSFLPSCWRRLLW